MGRATAMIHFIRGRLLAAIPVILGVSNPDVLDPAACCLAIRSWPCSRAGLAPPSGRPASCPTSADIRSSFSTDEFLVNALRAVTSAGLSGRTARYWTNRATGAEHGSADVQEARAWRSCWARRSVSLRPTSETLAGQGEPRALACRRVDPSFWLGHAADLSVLPTARLAAATRGGGQWDVDDRSCRPLHSRAGDR